MTFNIDEYIVDIPKEAAKDYTDTMKTSFDEDNVRVYLYAALRRNPDVSPEELSAAVVNELYTEISRYDTYTGKHCI